MNGGFFASSRLTVASRLNADSVFISSAPKLTLCQVLANVYSLLELSCFFVCFREVYTSYFGLYVIYFSLLMTTTTTRSPTSLLLVEVPYMGVMSLSSSWRTKNKQEAAILNSSV